MSGSAAYGKVIHHEPGTETRTGDLRWLWVCAGGAALLAGEPVTAAPLPCPGLEAQVVLYTKQHRLLLCEQGHPAAEYRIALGRGGTGKQREGDLKTPLGMYPLGPARPSAEFGLFLPVGYPADEQRRRGLTGGDIGIHGPKRGFRWLGSWTALTDWTRGCIAVGTDGEISELATWVREHHATRIHIL